MICRYCKKDFSLVHLHEPRCKENPINKINDELEKEIKKLKRLNKDELQEKCIENNIDYTEEMTKEELINMIVG